MTNKTKYQKFEKRTISRSDLKGAPYNPRRITKNAASRLKDSIRSHGLVGGIVWNVQTGNIVSGHQRLTQLDELEESQDYSLDVDVVDIPHEDEVALNIALNNPSMQGQYDDDMLAAALQEVLDVNMNVERTGFTSHDVFLMLGDESLQGEFAEQRDAEAETIAEIANIKDASKEDAGPTEFGGEKLPADDDGKEPSLAVPTPKSNDWSEKDPKEVADALAARRKEYAGEVEREEEANFMVTLVFADNDQRAAFQAYFGLDSEKLYYDTYDIQSAFGVDLLEDKDVSAES